MFLPSEMAQMNVDLLSVKYFGTNFIEILF